MPSYSPPKRATEFIHYVALISQANTKVAQANPTLAAGDVKVSKDGGALANLTTLPTVTPAAGKLVKVTLSAVEMTADNVAVVFSDAAGAEWCDLVQNIPTSVAQFDDLATPAQVNAEVLDVLDVTTYPEPGQGELPVDTTLADKINHIYKFLRNKVTQNANTQSIFNDAGTVVDHKATVSDDGTTFTRNEFVSGP